MVENMTFIICVAACVAGGIFAWWVENRPGDDTEDSAEGAAEEKSSVNKNSDEKK